MQKQYSTVRAAGERLKSLDSRESDGFVGFRSGRLREYKEEILFGAKRQRDIMSLQ